MNPQKTAVVLIEFQNDFTSEGGKLHEAVRDVMASTHMLENTKTLVKAARKRGATIFLMPISFAPDYRELTSQPYGILKGVVDAQAFQKGTWGVELVDGLQPQEGDIVVEGKRGLCGFASTNLDFMLRSKGITHVALAGFLTNCCVESTMRTGYELGYRIVTLTDCCATLSEEEQRVALEKDFPMFSFPMTSHEFLEQLGQEEAELEGAGRGYTA
ncbi:Nicotinamidase-related amidase [Catalinimonas alkaloidigena]|uniref:Nicotinamidase-related amidase n=1 Tax=Catalinimonas alkaloidigena TaxID=1075417 RepID=A0A1G9AFI5_9BACT|nr:cysteine hydrolase [Catalinimonas alkaloidigena]SDK26142.1 Nicotinamidase-related amidase [Catalinimonas alkaloidigena]